jgi:hypothetical protein
LPHLRTVYGSVKPLDQSVRRAREAPPAPALPTG